MNIGEISIHQCEEYVTENTDLTNTNIGSSKNQDEIVSKSNIKILCGNCVNLKSCVFAKHVIAPVMYCEEYRDN